MSDIEFNPKLSTTDATRETEAEREAKDVQKAQQKAAAFQQAMQRAPQQGTAAAAAHGIQSHAALAAIRQANAGAAGTPGVKAQELAVTQQAEAKAIAAQTQAAGAGGPGAATTGGAMQTLSAKSPPANSEGGGSSVGSTMQASGGASAGSASPWSGEQASVSGTPVAASQAAQQHTQHNSGGEGGANDANKQAFAGLKHEPVSREDVREKPSPRSDATVPRIDLASIIPSFPLPAAPLHAAAAPASRPLINTDLIQRIVEYALVTQNAQGQSEFHLGLAGAQLGGIGVHLTACGRRRVRVRFTGVGDSEAISDGDVSALIESLRAKNVEVAEVIMD